MRLLFVLDCRWDPRLGAAKVLIDLAAELTRDGHDVDVLDTAAVAGRTRMSQKGFRKRVIQEIRRRPARYDVIDALQANLSIPKSELGFAGLLVSRSVGLTPIYAAHALTQLSHDSGPLARVKAARSGRDLRRRANEAWRSYETADLVNVPTQDESDYLRDHGVPHAAVVANGLADSHLDSLQDVRRDACETLARPHVVAVGGWSARKGAHDWGRVIDRVWAERGDVRFSFLGTGIPREAVFRDLGLASGHDQVRVLESFDPHELPGLLASATVSALPSAAEGFGLGVVESLSAGLPVVAYDVSGPRSTLVGLAPEDLVIVGDADAFANRIVARVRMSAPSYESFSSAARLHANRFRCSVIARKTVDLYTAELDRLGGSA